MARNVILSKFKNTFSFENTFSVFYFLKVENKKSNQICFENSNFLKMKTVNKNKKMKMQIKHTLNFLTGPLLLLNMRKIFTVTGGKINLFVFFNYL